MRTISIASVLLGQILLAAIARAQLPATQPASPEGYVYLLPFTPIGGDDRLDWAGKAVEQNLLTDLARGRLHPVAADQRMDTTDALTTARSAGAKYLITGTYHTTDQLLRFNGQIIDVASGTVVGGITATGAERDLFSMEDSLSVQAVQQLSKLAAGAQPAAVPAAALPPPMPPIPPVLAQLAPPAAVAGSSYDGSALQAYVDTNRTPSSDYDQQVQNARDRNTYSTSTDYGFYNGYYGGYYGNYGVGVYYTLGASGGGFGYSPGFGGRGSFGRGISGHGFGAGGYFGHGAHSR